MQYFEILLWLIYLCLIIFTSGLNPAECEVNFLKIVKNMDFYGVDIHTVVVRNTPFIDLLFSEITAVLKFDILPIQILFTFNKCNKSCSCLVIASKFPFVFTL